MDDPDARRLAGSACRRLTDDRDHPANARLGRRCVPRYPHQRPRGSSMRGAVATAEDGVDESALAGRIRRDRRMVPEPCARPLLDRAARGADQHIHRTTTHRGLSLPRRGSRVRIPSSAPCDVAGRVIGRRPGFSIFTTCLPPRVAVQPCAWSSRLADRWLNVGGMSMASGPSAPGSPSGVRPGG